MNIIKLASYLNKKWADYLPQEEETPVEIPSPNLRRDMPLSIEDPLPEQPSEAISSPGGSPQEERELAELLWRGLSKVRAEFDSDYISIKEDPSAYRLVPNYILEGFEKLWTLVDNALRSPNSATKTATEFLVALSNIVSNGIKLQDRIVFPHEIVSTFNYAMWKDKQHENDDDMPKARARAITELFELAKKLNNFITIPKETI